MELPARIEGWLKVYEELDERELSKSTGHLDAIGVVTWKLQYCVILFKGRKLYHFDDKQNATIITDKYPGTVIRLDKEFLNLRPALTSSNKFRFSPASSPKIRRTQSTFRRKRTDIVQDNDERSKKKSASIAPANINLDANNSSKISGFPRRVKTAIKRTKSTGRFDKDNRVRGRHDIIEGGDNMMSMQLKPTRSHESLHIDPGSTQDLINLVGQDLIIRPLHSSILGQDHCFQITTSLGSKYYSCRSASERDKWIESILSTIYPDKDDKRRLDSSLKMWVVEGKNMPGKKRYFCEICLDSDLFARTTPKMRGDVLFWGEQFQFSCLPEVQHMNVHVYKEIDKKRKRDKNYLGLVTIPIEAVTTKSAVEKWFPLNGVSTGRGDPPSLRIKAHYQSLSILPIAQYSELAQYLKYNAVSLCNLLEQDINVKMKEEFATCLVKVLQCLGIAKDFLVDLVTSELDGIKEESLVFRANTMATKSMEAYMKLIGGKYLQDTLGDFVQDLYEKDEDCEVDASKITSGSLHHHQASLTLSCEMACCKILNSSIAFPSEMRRVFQEFRKRFGDKINGHDLCNKLISSCIFLRFLCPAIMSPSLFDLVQEFPSERTSRCLTLIAKTIQALANFTKFGAKESYMVFMNEFLEREWGNMKGFLHEISTTEDRCHLARFDGYIDLGKEMALLHTLLVEALSNSDKSSDEAFVPLNAILSNITENLEQPGEFISYHSGEMRMRSNYHNTSTTTVSTSLKKIFEDDSLRDVEMLPPYNIAMDRTIVTSSTVNSLVDFIQKDGESSVSARSEIENTKYATENVCEETDRGKLETSKSASVENNRTVEESRTQNEDGSSVSVKKEVVTKKESFSFKVETNGSLQPNVSTQQTKPNVSSVRHFSTASDKRFAVTGSPKVMPLSFSNPAFQLATRSVKSKDPSPSDSGSSVNSNMSSGHDSNIDGDISQSSSSEGASPTSNRRVQPPSTSVMSHTLPKISPRTPIYVPFEDLLLSQQTESQSMSSLHRTPKQTVNNNYKSAVALSMQIQSPTEAVKAANLAAKAAFFAEITSPSTETVPGRPKSPTRKISEARLQIGEDKENQRPSFAITIQNPMAAPVYPRRAVSTALSLPLESALTKDTKALRTAADSKLMAISEHQSSSSIEIETGDQNVTSLEIKTTPYSPTHLGTAALDDPPTRSTAALDDQPTRSKSLPSPKKSLSTSHLSSPPMSPGQGQIARPKIRTQLASKPKSTPDVISSLTRDITPAFGDGVFIHTKKTTKTQSSHTRTYMVQQNIGTFQEPIWTRRLKDPNAADREVQTEGKNPDQVKYETEIENLKIELEKMSHQLAETQIKLEEEGRKAEEALKKMETKMEVKQKQLTAQSEEREEKEKQIRDIINRLMSVEDDLKRGQEEMHAVVTAKQKIIDAQERRIESLDAANVQLMSALEQLKERYKVKRRTKSQGDLQVSTAKLSLSGNIKGTQC